jgi:hypothetical protein
MDYLNKEICELCICIVESFERRRQNDTSLSVKSSGLNESGLTISQTAHSVPLPHIHLSTWTIGQEQDKMENTPNKSSPETVVQETVGCIRAEIKKGEQCDHLSETHLKKEEALGVQSTLQAQFKEKQNSPIFKPIVDKDSILRMSRRQILDESENPCRLPNFIKLSYSQKLKRKDLTAFSASCKAIFQGRLPLKKKNPGSFNSTRKLSMREARCGLGEGMNLTPTWLIENLESIF